MCLFSNSRHACRSVGRCVVTVTGSASCWACSCPAAWLHLPGASWTWTTWRDVMGDSSAPVTTATSTFRWRSSWWCTSFTWWNAGTVDCAPSSTTASTPAPCTSWSDSSPTRRRSSGGERFVITTSVALARWRATATATPSPPRRFFAIYCYYCCWQRQSCPRFADLNTHLPPNPTWDLRKIN